MDNSTHANTVFPYGKTTFAMGLFWQALAKPRELKKEALELAARHECDLYLVRAVEGIAQTALASSKSGYASGQVSFAAVVAASIKARGLTINGQRNSAPSWLGAFDLGNGKWAFIAVRDNAIMPTGDFLGEKHEVIDMLEQNYGLGAWNAVVGAPEIGDTYHNFVEASFEDFLPRNKRGQVKFDNASLLASTKLRISKRTGLIAACGALVIAAGGIGYAQWKSYQEEKEREEAIARVRAAMAANKTVESAEIPHPWASAPLAGDMAEACEAGFVHLAPGGWKLSGYSCTDATISYAFDRSGSTISWLKEILPDAKVDGTGEKATLTRVVSYREKRDEALESAESLRLDLLNTAQHLGLKIEIAEEVPPPPKQSLPGEQLIAKPEAPKPDWRTFNIKVGPTTMKPTAVTAAIHRSGLRFQKIVKHEGQWLLSGAIYAR